MLPLLERPAAIHVSSEWESSVPHTRSRKIASRKGEAAEARDYAVWHVTDLHRNRDLRECNLVLAMTLGKPRGAFLATGKQSAT
jgi:hypothetical protein